MGGAADEEWLTLRTGEMAQWNHLSCKLEDGSSEPQDALKTV